ncbi:MAG: hypothetical protein ACRAVC_06575 [Trichormus sp.]
MLHLPPHSEVKIFKNIFGTISIGLILCGLCGCTLNQQPSSPTIERPSIQSDPSPTDIETDEDQDEEENDQGDTEQNSENDTDKNENN